MQRLLSDGWTFRSLALLTVLAALVAACRGLASLHPLIEAVTNVQAQVAFVALVPLVGFIVLREWRWVAIAGVTVLVLFSPLVPIWTARGDPVVDERPVAEVMQYNIFFGNTDYPAIAEHIHRSDAAVVALHELLPEQWEQLAPLLSDYPHQIAAPLDPNDGQPGGGMALLSKAPLRQLDLGPDVSPTERVLLAAVTEIAGANTLVIGLHPHASRHESHKVELRERQMQEVVELAHGSDLPTIVLTDLNLAPTSPDYRSFVEDLHWRDPHRLVGWQSSWPTWAGPFGLPIDHIFVSDEIALHSYTTGDGAGSDHKSVVATISMSDQSD